MSRLVGMRGQKHGRLLVLRKGEHRTHGGGVARWVCQCDCGNIVNIPGARLRQGQTRSCGCLRIDRTGQRFKLHGKSKTQEYKMFYDARKRAYQRNLPFSITLEDILIPKKCPVLGIDLDLNGRRDNKPSLDRVIPEKGYVPDNICVISFRANRIKSDANIKGLQAVIDYIFKVLN